jgi:alpha,alpha-trehalase
VSRTPIGDYALLSDCHCAALVSRAGSVDWLCFPRFDGPSVFARLLDDRAGHWSIGPTDPATVRRRYRRATMVLETEFRTSHGTVLLTEAMASGPNQGHELGAGAPRVLLRRVECRDGRAEVQVSFAPRMEYGLARPQITTVDGGIRARGGADILLLSSGRPLEVRDGVAVARFDLRAGQGASFALTHRASWEPSPTALGEKEIEGMLEETTAAWQSWSKEHQNYEGPWEDLVMHSGAVLQALTFQPTGAIVAAPTTSLPESVGGVRNWDYRYAWIRDASLTMEALWVAACPDEARDFFDWMTGAAAAGTDAGADLQTMFGVGGEHDLTERELPHLAGWRDSRPVRVGNAAWTQRQSDIYGELLSSAYRLREQLGEIDEPTRAFLIGVTNLAAARWVEPDQGIWEVREPPRDFLYSKLMCWVAVDRAIRMADQLQAGDHVDGWVRTRSEIERAILTQGWSDRAGAFTQAFGSDDLDASALTIPIVGFLPGDDDRVVATIEAVERELTDDRGLVYRYRARDGLPGEEGSFLLCTFWLAHAWALAGRLSRAREVMERAVGYVNDVGLMAEEVDPASGEFLGNFPQAFSHVGLVNAAWAIAQGERGR